MRFQRRPLRTKYLVDTPAFRNGNKPSLMRENEFTSLETAVLQALIPVYLWEYAVKM